MSHSQFHCIMLYLDVHGLIFEISVWLLAGSTRLLYGWGGVLRCGEAEVHATLISSNSILWLLSEYVISLNVCRMCSVTIHASPCSLLVLVLCMWNRPLQRHPHMLNNCSRCSNHYDERNNTRYRTFGKITFREFKFKNLNLNCWWYGCQLWLIRY